MHLATPTTSPSYPAPTPASLPTATDSKIALWTISLLLTLIVLCIIIEQLKGMDPLVHIYYAGLVFRELHRAWRYAIFETLLKTMDPTLPALLYRPSTSILRLGSSTNIILNIDRQSSTAYHPITPAQAQCLRPKRSHAFTDCWSKITLRLASSTNIPQKQNRGAAVLPDAVFTINPPSLVKVKVRHLIPLALPSHHSHPTTPPNRRHKSVVAPQLVKVE
ncbi:hypothetical protein PENSPDRAFT_690282 [Peniophora sp. CONT]|nr:hypothetical protein PENSPDRAFT_690282 [Peniophora sp. CONT]